MFDFGAFPTLRTERIDLRELDASFVRDIFAVRSDPVVQLYNSAPHLANDDTLRFIAEQRTKYSRHTEISWALLVRDLGRVVGDLTLFDWDHFHRRALIGYELAQDQWDKGLASEAIRAVLRFAFEQMALNRVEI
jgi:ribosomal-protein-alanine N-acetyltransferase